MKRSPLAYALRLGAPAVLGVWSVVASCEQPHVDVPVRPAKDGDDRDDDRDEGMRRRCSDDDMCSERRPNCYEGFCVECYLPEHCLEGYTCEPGDWECDSPG